MLRKFISRFSFSCIKNQDETDESEQQNIENEHTVKMKCFAERPKSREIPIPSTLRSGSGGHRESLGRDYEAGASMNYIKINRNKCRQSAEEIKMARISLHDLMDLDVGFQFGKNGRTEFTESKAERNGETPPRKDEDTELSLVTPCNS
uniref:Uncharacterized protein n=1 Tax=Anopheles atroparvus TaxID=41427 RepID=A0AAG5D8G1_ANOAO